MDILIKRHKYFVKWSYTRDLSHIYVIIFFRKSPGGIERGTPQEKGWGGGGKIMYDLDDVYQYTKCWLLLYISFIMQPSLFLYSLMGLLISKYKRFWNTVTVKAGGVTCFFINKCV